MGKHPVIGLNMSLETIEADDRWEVRVPLPYVDAVIGAGGLPLLIPPCEDPAMMFEMTAILDGIILIGGNDYFPGHYGGHAQPEWELMPSRRDCFDVAMSRWILQSTDLPVLGICGGHQLMAIAEGGILVQDIKTEWMPPKDRPPLPHARSERPEASSARFRHPVTMVPGSLVARAVGAVETNQVNTNSFHHQAIHPDTPGQHFAVSAWAADGIVEAIEPATASAWSRSGRFVLGVQWHPERMQDEEPHRRLFHALIRAADRHQHR